MIFRVPSKVRKRSKTGRECSAGGVAPVLRDFCFIEVDEKSYGFWAGIVEDGEETIGEKEIDAL